MRQVRYCGGPRDGQYQGWENDRGMPLEICTIEPVAMSVADYFDSDPMQAAAPAYTRYQRVGYQDVTGAELYATGEVINACRRGVPLSAQGIAPVRLGHEIVRLIGGPHHNERVTIGRPIPSLVDVPADIGREWTPDAEISPTEQTTRYYCLFRRDGSGVLIYVSTEFMRDIVRGVVPPVADVGMLVALTRAAIRFRAMNSLLASVASHVGQGRTTSDLANALESPFTYEMAYATDAEMSGRKEYPLDAVARENERRSAAMQKAQECIDAIQEVTDD
jgi:hypothetical protein